MMHPRVVKHLKIDLIGIYEAVKCPESKEDCQLYPTGLELKRLASFNVIIYLDSVFHLFSNTTASIRFEELPVPKRQAIVISVGYDRWIVCGYDYSVNG